MKKVNVEKFLNDFDVLVKEKEELVAGKEVAIANAKASAEAVVAEKGLSERIGAILVKEMVEEVAETFNFDEVDSKIALFAEYLEDVEEVVEQVEEVVEQNEVAPEQLYDEFGNLINA